MINQFIIIVEKIFVKNSCIRCSEIVTILHEHIYLILTEINLIFMILSLIINTIRLNN